MSNWIKTKDRLPEPLEDVLFLSKNGCTYLGWRSAKNIWYIIYEINIKMPNSHVKAWCPIPKYDLDD